LGSGKNREYTQLEIMKKTMDKNITINNTLYRIFLAPDIIRAIMNGTQPIHQTGDSLKKHTRLPLDLEDQRKLLVFKQACWLAQNDQK